MSDWLHYSAVIPTEDYFKVDTYPSFRSVRDIKIQSDIEWEDTEYCDYGAGFSKRATFYSNGSPKVGTGTFLWTWGEEDRLPKVQDESTCYIETIVIKEAPLDILRKAFDKKQYLTSETYEYVN